MNPKKIFNIKNAVSLVKYTEEGQLVVVDERNTVRIYNISDLKLMGGFKINLTPNKPLENGVSVSNDGKYLALGIRGKKRTTVWNLETKKLMYTLGWHKGEVLSVAFDNASKYLLTGGIDGRVYMWSLHTGKMVNSLPPHADYIMDVGFSKNNLWVASCSYDRLVSITNLSTMNSFRNKAHKGAVLKLKFLRNHKLVTGDKTGEIAIWNYTKGKVDKRLTGLTDLVIDFAVDNQEEYLFAVTKEKKVYLFDLKNYELITNEYIKLSELPSKIEYIPEFNYLVVGTLDGGVYIYDLLEDENHLNEFLEKKEFDKAYELVTKNPFLRYTDVYKKMEEVWERTLDLAQKYLEKGESERAKSLLAPYLKVPLKRAVVQALLKDFAEFEKFKTAVLAKKYPLAYSLANKYPAFKNTIYYKKMEDEWRKIFRKARELILIKGRDDQVRELLKPFRGVGEKTPLIQSLFNEKQIYEFVKKKLAQKDFKEFFLLVGRYPFLTDTEEYEKVLKIGENLFNAAENALKKGDFHTVKKYAEILQDFPQYEEKAKELNNKAEILSNFLRAIATHDYKTILDYVQRYPFLEENEEFIKYEEEWNRKVELAEEYAAKGEVLKIVDLLKDYMHIKEKQLRIANLVKSAYLNQIMNLLVRYIKEKKGAEYLKRAVKNYISLFGIDAEIGDVIDHMRKLKIPFSLEGVQEGDIKELFNYNLPDKIWENIS